MLCFPLEEGMGRQKPSSLPVVLCNGLLFLTCLWFGRGFLMVVVVCVKCAYLCSVLTDCSSALVRPFVNVLFFRSDPARSCVWVWATAGSAFGLKKHVLVSRLFYLKCVLPGTKKWRCAFSFCLVQWFLLINCALFIFALSPFVSHNSCLFFSILVV